MRHLARGFSSALLVGLMAGCGSHGSSGSSTTSASPDPGGLSIDRGNPGKGGGGGGRPPKAGTEVGNNLSLPTVFAEGYGITGISSATADPNLPDWQQLWTGLRTVPSTVNYVLPPDEAATWVSSTGVTYWLQGIEQASWQATWVNGKDGRIDTTDANGGPWTTVVKWGDNLLGEWTTTSTIHVEVAMTSTGTINVGGIVYFPTTALYGSGSTEQFGTTGVSDVTAPSLLPFDVYSDNAYMTIALLDSDGVEETPPIHTLATWNRSAEGPSTNALTPEVNASGNVDYSYNWFTGRDNLQPGTYRLTFGVLPCSGCTLPGITPVTQTSGNVTIEKVVVPADTEGGPTNAAECGSVPPSVVNCDTATNTSYIDITLVSGSTIGGGHGSGHGGGSSGGGSGSGGGGGGSGSGSGGGI